MENPDKDFFEIAAAYALSVYAAEASMPPIGIVDGSMGLMVLPLGNLSDRAEKDMAMDVMRYISVESKGTRSALLAEVWMLDSSDPKDVELMDEIYERGGSMREHPKAIEALMVNVESDHGNSVRKYEIVRNGKTTELKILMDEHENIVMKGPMSGFHILTKDRETPEIQEFMREMGKTLQIEREPFTFGNKEDPYRFN